MAARVSPSGLPLGIHHSKSQGRTMKRAARIRKSELRVALGSCKSAFVGVGVFSGLINILMLTGALFMLEVYDRVLPSRSIPTLVALCVLAAVLFTFQALLDVVRGRLLVRIGGQIDAQLGPLVYDATIGLAKSGRDVQQPARDLDAIRSFTSGTGLTALFDLLCIPFPDRDHRALRRGRSGDADTDQRSPVSWAGPGCNDAISRA